MRLVCCCWFFLLFVHLVISMPKVRHIVAHDGFHNIKKESHWRNLPARGRSHHKRNHSN
ncbi:uncharacterized protein LOC108098364 isoform X2 [Drosophila ficusphila]|uniref:uncharacterized protein LOC108098364 isoform X2 n=1 Tax=Drosophila ficusphila TaxID=30025 RepID=UPI0007E71E5A|nr:uncharacterized protein LOC108098364 isoform X2 [Drosophila ficusphila]